MCGDLSLQWIGMVGSLKVSLGALSIRSLDPENGKKKAYRRLESGLAMPKRPTAHAMTQYPPDFEVPPPSASVGM